jgi:N utilization substance protein A
MRMNGELLTVLDYIEREKGISRETIMEAVESSLLSASRKTLPTAHNLSVQINKESGDIHVFADVLVVSDAPSDPPETIAIEEAIAIDSGATVGEYVTMEVTPHDFGRIAAQTAKQVIIQKLREAEKNLVFDEFKDRVGTLVNGIVRRHTYGAIIVDVGRAEAILPAREQCFGERYPIGSRISVYVTEVKDAIKGPEIIVSRTHPSLVERLFELEIPEITDGIVHIKGIAREAGHRTKIAVHSTDEKVDPVGACVGLRGARVKNIVRELNGEKIDIIKWSDEVAAYVQNALSPAKLKKVEPNEAEKSVTVIVSEDQLSLAIGKKGQNARLTAKLVGWRVDIFSEEKMEELRELQRRKILSLPGIGEKALEILQKAGYTSVDGIAATSVEELEKLPGFGKATAEKLLKAAKESQQGE